MFQFESSCSSAVVPLELWPCLLRIIYKSDYDLHNYEEDYDEGVGCNNNVVDLIISN